jgi:Na+/H+-dicarboxylate symporter
MTNMLLNILIGLAGWSILALVAGLCIGNALRVSGEWDGTAASVRTKQPLKKTA